MPKPQATLDDVQAVHRYFTDRGLHYLRARKYGALVIIESGLPDDPIPHARLRRDTVHLWTLEMAMHTGRREKTGFRGLREELLNVLTNTLPWTIAPLD